MPHIISTLFISTEWKRRIAEVIPIEGICLQPGVIDGENRTDHYTRNSVPYSLQLVLWTLKSCEKGPTVQSPYPRRLESLSICRCNYKGSTFSSFILRPRVVVQPGFEPTTFCMVVWYSINWAIGLPFFKFIHDRAVFKWLSKVITRLRLLRLVIGLKDSRQFFNQWEAKPKPIIPCTRDFSRALNELQVISRSCDWFIAVSAPVVIGRSNCFGFGFSTVIWKPL